MTLEEALRALWRRKWIVLATVVITTVGTYLISRALPEVYTADATLYIKDPSEDAASDFEAIQSAQVLAKTYAELIQSENVADEVAGRLHGDDTGGEILGRMSFEPLPDTQLVVINSQGETAEEAADLANTYGSVFVDYASGADLGEEIEGDVTVADPATEPSSPVRPRPVLYAGIAGVLGLFVGAGLALLRDRFDTRLGTSEEISEALGVPILARIPSASARTRTPLDPIRDERFFEALRILFANLRFVSRGNHPESVLITSPGAGEGKSTVCMGLAHVAAEHGNGVVILEGDLRRPALSDSGGAGAPVRDGLSRVLDDDMPFDQALDSIALNPADGILILPAGSPAENPSALLQPEPLHQLMDAATAIGDLVIVDSPPLSVGPDAMLLSQPAAATVLIVSHRRTSRPAAVAAMRQLRQAGARVLGVVVNQVPADEHDYYSYGRQSARRRASSPSVRPGRTRSPV